MIRRMKLPIWMALAALAACGGGGGGVQLPEGAVVGDGPFESYTTTGEANAGLSRVRKENLGADSTTDAANLKDFEEGKGPADYRELIRLADRDAAGTYTGKLIVEVVAQVDTASGDKANRILRLTADHTPLERIKDGQIVEAKGSDWYFRGQSFAWVTIDNGPLLSGHHPTGLVNMNIDFDNQVMNIKVITGSTGGTNPSEVDIEFVAEGLPFNASTGAYGGDIVIHVRDPNIDRTYDVPGYVRGSVGGSLEIKDGVHGLSTSGLFTGETPQGADHAVTVDGIYIGVHEQALPNAVP